MQQVHQGAISLRLRSSFSSTKYTSLGAILPPKCLSEMLPRGLTLPSPDLASLHELHEWYDKHGPGQRDEPDRQWHGGQAHGVSMPQIITAHPYYLYCQPAIVINRQ